MISRARAAVLQGKPEETLAAWKKEIWSEYQPSSSRHPSAGPRPGTAGALQPLQPPSSLQTASSGGHGAGEAAMPAIPAVYPQQRPTFLQPSSSRHPSAGPMPGSVAAQATQQPHPVSLQPGSSSVQASAPRRILMTRPLPSLYRPRHEQAYSGPGATRELAPLPTHRPGPLIQPQPPSAHQHDGSNAVSVAQAAKAPHAEDQRHSSSPSTGFEAKRERQRPHPT